MRLKYIVVFWLALALLGLPNPAGAYICDNAKFFEECPTDDPAFAKFITDFKIRKNGVLIDPSMLTCHAPVSAIPIAEWTDELVLLQSLRAIYYMDLGRSGHLPWTSGTLYDWLKAGIGGIDISPTVTSDQYVGALYALEGDTANYFQVRPKDDMNRTFQKKWAGIALFVSLIAHERRHADGIAFNHHGCCPAGPNACDLTYEETANLTPYGVQYWLEKNWISGFIDVGVGCMLQADKDEAIALMRSDANGKVISSNFCTNTPPVLTDTNNPPGSCMCAGISGSSNGEPHITTLDGLYYDFQAAGDFLLTENGPSFIVQVRQRWTPNRPNVAFNKAVAMQMGKTRVAVFLDPTRLVVDGHRVALADGKTLSLPDNVEVSRKANVYVIKRGSGETVRVEAVDNDWVKILGGSFMDVKVSLNYTAYGGMRGLLGNGNGNVLDDIAARDGQVLAQPVSFEDLYRRYGASMSIRPGESLFGEDRGTGPAAAAFEAPGKPFTVKDLTPREYEPARAACVKVGVEVGPLLDACTLDVAVLRSPAVAKLYTGVVAPSAVMEPGAGIRIIPAGGDLTCKRTCSKPRRRYWLFGR